jgi:hypothetical protein
VRSLPPFVWYDILAGNKGLWVFPYGQTNITSSLLYVVIFFCCRCNYYIIQLHLYVFNY